MTTAVGMNAALSLDATGVKWPFTPQRRPVAQRPSRRPAAATAPASLPGAAPVVHATAPSDTLAAAGTDRAGVLTHSPDSPLSPEGTGRVTAIQGGQAFTSLGLSAGAGVLAAGVGAQVSRRQMISDIALVTFWAAMIPGMLWLGHAAGF